jgi:hypothetical protein
MLPMKREMMQGMVNGDPTMQKYTRSNIVRTLTIIRKSHRPVFEEQALLRMHRRKHEKEGIATAMNRVNISSGARRMMIGWPSPTASPLTRPNLTH